MKGKTRDAINPRQSRGLWGRSRHGLTLVELLLSLAILVMIAGALAGLAKAVQMNSDYGEGQATATQHARVALERIERSVSEAVASESFPGLLVVDSYAGASRFPDTLIVWHPAAGTTAVDPQGLPRFHELVLYYPNPQQANQLLEVTLPGDSRVAPSADDPSAWSAAVASIKSAQGVQTVVLTDMLRTASASRGNSTASRGAVRFESRLRPSADEWKQYRDGAIPWKKLPWVQGIGGWQTGLRQAWVRMELQLTPAGSTGAGGASVQPAATFFGSATVYYEMHR